MGRALSNFAIHFASGRSATALRVCTRKKPVCGGPAEKSQPSRRDRLRNSEPFIIATGRFFQKTICITGAPLAPSKKAGHDARAVSNKPSTFTGQSLSKGFPFGPKSGSREILYASTCLASFTLGKAPENVLDAVRSPVDRTAWCCF